MKCPNYDPDEYGCMSPWVIGRCPHPEGRCRLGWILFWTPAERAGLKALGEWYCLETGMRTDREKFAAEYFIRQSISTFVKAARAAKEGK